MSLALAAAQLPCVQEAGTPLPLDEWMLVRFLRARGAEATHRTDHAHCPPPQCVLTWRHGQGNRDIEASVAMITNSLQWRASFGTDDIFHTIDFPEKDQATVFD